MKRLLRWYIALPAIAVIGFICVHLYLRSDTAAVLVREKLEESLGTSAQFESMSVGLTESSVSSLKLYEKDSGPGSEPFLTSKRVDVDIASVGAIRGKSPKSMRFQEPRVLLRFNRAGSLLTQFPTSGPGGNSLDSIDLASGLLVIRQEGRPDTVFRGIDLTISFAGELTSLKGRANDPEWGRWTIDGSVPLGKTGAGLVRFQTIEPKVVTPLLLAQVPLVNPKAWTHVSLSGTTTGKVELTFDVATQGVGYNVALVPTETRVHIPAIGLNIAEATGSFVAEKGIITLKDISGKAASGIVRVNSRLDFSKLESDLKFETTLVELSVGELPKTWKIPPKVGGLLTGKVDLAITLPEHGGTIVRADGKASIATAAIDGHEQMRLDLDIQTDPGGGLHFAERQGSGPEPFDIVAKVPQPVAQPAPQKDEFLRVDIKLRGVSVAELLRSTGVEVSIPVEGNLSADLRLAIPSDTPSDVQKYRLSGEITKGTLKFDMLAADDLLGKLEMKDGMLRLTELTGRSPEKNGRGRVKVSGEMAVEEPYAFKATATFEKYPLGSLDRLQEIVSLAGDAFADAKLDGTLSPLAIRSSGDVRVDRLKSGDVETGAVRLRWESDADRLRVTEATIGVFGGKVSGTFDVPLRERFSATGQLKIENLDLGEVSKSMLATVSLKMEGKANGSVKFRNSNADPIGQTIADVELEAPSLKLQGILASKIKGTATYASKVLNYVLTGDSLGGQVEVSGQYPPETKGAQNVVPGEKANAKDKDLTVIGRLKLRRVQMSALSSLLGVESSFSLLTGEVSADFPFALDSEGQFAGGGRLRAERMTWNNLKLSSGGEAIVRLSSRAISFEEVTLFVGEGTVRGQAVYNRIDPERSELTLSLTKVPARSILFWMPEGAGRFELPISGRLTTTMGKEWRGTGVLTSARGTIYNVPVTDLRVPIEWSTTPNRSRTEFRVREATAMAAGGQVSARGEWRKFNDLPPKFSGDVQFRSVNMSRAAKSGSQVGGNLLVTGNFDFASAQFRTSDDITAKLDVKLGESQPFSLPIFSAVSPFLGLGSTPTTRVREGEAKAVLANNVWRVEKFSLMGSSVDLYADGTVSTSGRLSLAVIARTQQSPDRRALQRIVPIPSLSATSTTRLGPTMLANLTGFLGRYVVYLNVTGTTDSPIVRLETLRTLSEDAARFFLFRFLAPLP